MKLDFSIQLFSSLNKQGLEELASVMGGRLNFTLEQAHQFDLDSIPEATGDDVDVDQPEFLETDKPTASNTETK
jgi:GTP-binding protein